MDKPFKCLWKMSIVYNYILCIFVDIFQMQQWLFNNNNDENKKSVKQNDRWTKQKCSIKKN